MHSIVTVRTSLRSARARARAPRLLVYAFVAVMCLIGVRSLLHGPARPVVARSTPPPLADRGAETFAEGFVRAYLTWDAQDPAKRKQALAGYLPSALGADAGLVPAAGTDETVDWAQTTNVRRNGTSLTVNVAAQTSRGAVQLAVPVARDTRGFLYLTGYPAFIGAPPVRHDVTLTSGDRVEDAALSAVVRRALGNYLAGARDNLLADLTPGAVVSLPARSLHVTSVQDPTWVQPGRRVAVEVHAQDDVANTWTLQYELTVSRRDRWYVQSFELDPTGRSE
jgi:Conjugative transposon protein TcpC